MVEKEKKKKIEKNLFKLKLFGLKEDE